MRGLLKTAGLILLVVGIAGPQWGQVADMQTAPGRDIVVVLDVSRSMLAQDVLGRSSPNRLGRARDSVIDLLDYVQRRGGHRLALIVFAARPQVICPLTHDYDHFREVVIDADPDNPLLEIQPETQSTVSGTRIGAALTEAVRLCDERYAGYENILLLSDGDDPGGDDEWRESLASAQQRCIRVDTVGIGAPDRDSPIPSGTDSQLTHDGMSVTTRLNEFPLEEIARKTGGRYIPGRTAPIALAEIFRNSIEPNTQRAHEEDLVPAKRQHSVWFFGAAFLCFAAAMLSGAHQSRRSIILLQSDANPANEAA